MFDLSTLDTMTRSEQGTRMPVRHPTTGKPLPGAFVGLLGVDSARYRAKLREILSRRLDDERPAPEALDAENAELYAACTTELIGLAIDGTTLSSSTADAQKAFQRFPWLREQAAAWMGNREHFFPEPSGDSNATPSASST